MKGVEKVFPDYYQTKTLYFSSQNYVSGNVNADSFSATEPESDPSTYPGLSSVILDISSIISGSTIYDIVDLFAEVKKGTGPWTTKNLGQIHAENYFSTLFGLNPVYTPNDDNLSYFYAVINKMLRFAGGTALVKQIDLLFPTPSVQMQVDGDNDVCIPYEYSDLYLTLAAYEAMLDVGDQIALQKANFYNQEILNQIKIIQVKEQLMKQADTDRTTEQ
jgi:hypothetical protein